MFNNKFQQQNISRSEFTTQLSQISFNHDYNMAVVLYIILTHFPRKITNYPFLFLKCFVFAEYSLKKHEYEIKIYYILITKSASLKRGSLKWICGGYFECCPWPMQPHQWTVPQLSIMIIYNCIWSNLIQLIRIILSADNLT